MIRLSQSSGGGGETTVNYIISDTIAKIASGTINAGSLATTSLSWINSCNLSNTVPMFAIIKKVSGTFALSSLDLKIGSTSVASESLASLTTTISPLSLAGNVDNGASLDVQVTAIELSSATFSVDIYGMKY